MNRMQALFARALLALAMVAGAVPAALAGPIYHVSIDTSTLTGPTGTFDFQFSSPADALPSSVRISKLAGAFVGTPDLQGDYSGTPASGITLGNNAPISWFYTEALLGGMFSFDLEFEQDATGNGSLFSLTVLDAAGASGLLTVALTPGESDFVDVVGEVAIDVAEASAVPEPSDWALVLTGLFLMGAMRRVGSRR